MTCNQMIVALIVAAVFMIAASALAWWTGIRMFGNPRDDK